MPHSEPKVPTSIHKLLPSATLADIEGVALLKGFQKDGSGSSKHPIIYYKRNQYTPGWKELLRPTVPSSSDTMEAKQSASESFVALFQLPSASSIYAITGGYGFRLLDDFRDKDFGVNILKRIIPKSNRSLRYTKERSIIGGVIGSSKFFRNNLNFFDNEQFGQIYEQLKADGKKALLEKHFSILKKSNKEKISITAKSTLSLGHSATLDEIYETIKDCEKILSLPSNVVINNISLLKGKSSENVRKELENELKAHLFDNYVNKNDYFPFDLCPANYESYLQASSYKVKIKKFKKDPKTNKSIQFFEDASPSSDIHSLSNIKELFLVLKKHLKKPSKKKLWGLLNRTIIMSYDENGEVLTSAKFLEHILGDVSHPSTNEKYFLIDKKWYQIESNFIDSLNKNCDAIVKDFKFQNSQLEDWEIGVDEKDYNALHVGKTNCLVLDRVLTDNIEVCDILQWDKNSVYLIHVKTGFGNTMRDLTSQISVASSRIQEARLSAGKNEFFEKLYDSLGKKCGGKPPFDIIGDQTQSISKADFCSLFDKSIRFVLAVRDEKNRSLDSMKNFNSTIAKFSLKSLKDKLNNQNTDLRIIQITALPKV